MRKIQFKRAQKVLKIESIVELSHYAQFHFTFLGFDITNTQTCRSYTKGQFYASYPLTATAMMNTNAVESPWKLVIRPRNL